ncbi:MAG: DNA polymerase III subunit delta' [Chloroflexi bacterium]|nr:DNA polymerase III subunit delta' [Chloroflexota bacterium]
MWTTIGHEWAVAALERAVAARRVPQAILFTGPAHVGKTHLALELAAALQCTGASPPCGACEACRRVVKGIHPDVRLVAPEGDHIKIGQIRSLQYDLALSPVQGAWRVCILTDFHTATPEAANAFLKTLEEPPGHAVIILTALDASLLLPTILSRCQVFALRPVPARRIAQALVDRWGEPLERAETLARLSAGAVGWAIYAREHPEILAEREERLRDLEALLTASRSERLLMAERYSKHPALSEVIGLWQTWWRDVLLECAGCGDLVAHADQREALKRTARLWNLPSAEAALRSTEEALEQLEHNANARLVLEVMFLSWQPLAA